MRPRAPSPDGAVDGVDAWCGIYFPVDDMLELPLRGAQGEPVDFARTIVSHGVAELQPKVIDLPGRTLVTTLPVSAGARTVRMSEDEGALSVEAVAGCIGASTRAALIRTVAHMFRLDEDLSGFYAVVSGDGDLAWCATGAGRMLRAHAVFEDVAKTN
jgi:3-methyladenine DNA glycosylase/8-oxoguanine DNA glycosylase